MSDYESTVEELRNVTRQLMHAVGSGEVREGFVTDSLGDSWIRNNAQRRGCSVTQLGSTNVYRLTRKEKTDEQVED